MEENINDGRGGAGAQDEGCDPSSSPMRNTEPGGENPVKHREESTTWATPEMGASAIERKWIKSHKKITHSRTIAIRGGVRYKPAVRKFADEGKKNSNATGGQPFAEGEGTRGKKKPILSQGKN